MSSSLIVVLVSLLLAAPAVISWLWLVIVPHLVTKLCPEECRCDIGGYFVECSRKSLNNIPSIYLTHVEGLILNDNNIISLEKEIFLSKGVTELDSLSLDRCGIQKLEVGAFNGLTKLTSLSMSENGIGEITRRTFEKMSDLEHLDLDYNKIENLDVDVFSGLVNLQNIDLGGNKLLKLHPDIFVGLPKLEYLDLRGNEGLQIPTDSHFITSHSLKYLDIHWCGIRSVSVQTFANVSALERLNLSSNKLRSLDVNILRSLPKLSSIPLYINPLHCDCQLKEVWRWCQDHNIKTDTSEAKPECDTPREVRWEFWGKLEELQCVQDNINNKDENEQKRYKHPDDENMQRHKIYTYLEEHVLVPLKLFFLIFGTTGNVIILIIIICNKDMRNVPNMYVLNLTISDMIFLAGVVIYSYVELSHELKCMFIPFCSRMSVGLSAYSVAVLSFQRYRVSVKSYVRVSSQPTWRVTVATICGVWIVAVLFAIPSAISKFLCFDPLTEMKYLAYYKPVVTFEFYVSCVLPLFLIAISLIMAARHLVERSCPVTEETKFPQMNTRKNDGNIVIGLSVVFLITYVPFHVLWTHIFFSPPQIIYMFRMQDYFYRLEDLLFMKVISFCLLLINSCLNPVAIFCTSSLFREHLKRYLCCCCKANSPPADIKITRRNGV